MQICLFWHAEILRKSNLPNLSLVLKRHETGWQSNLFINN